MRKGYVDILKTIGMLGIIVAHVAPPRWVLTVRSFDVPLLVILSGILAQKSSNLSYRRYVWKRFQRLVLPTWLFLCGYFGVSYIMRGRVFTELTIVKSFLFQQDSIGYVWIIWVYMLCACSVPVLKKLPDKNGPFVVVGIYILYEMAYRLGIGINYRIVYYTFYYYPYLVLTYYGLKIESIGSQEKACLAGIAGTVFVLMAVRYRLITGQFVRPETAKYPVRIYYLSFSIACSTILVLLFEKRGAGISRFPLIRFISAHSLWIYLWHIPLVSFSERLFGAQWMKRYIFVLTCSMLLTWVQNRVIEDFHSPRWDILKG